MLTQLIQRSSTILEQTDSGTDHFSEIVRRDIGRHPYRNTGTSVEQHIGQPCGQQPGLAQRPVKVKTPIHGTLTQFRQQHLSKAGKPGFGIAHRRKRPRIILGAPVTLPVYQWVTKTERLRHQHHRLIAGRVPMRMKLAQDIADGSRGLLIFR